MGQEEYILRMRNEDWLGLRVRALPSVLVGDDEALPTRTPALPSPEEGVLPEPVVVEGLDEEARLVDRKDLTPHPVVVHVQLPDRTPILRRRHTTH